MFKITANVNEDQKKYNQIISIIEDIKKRINQQDYSVPIHQNLTQLMKALSEINPFNNNIVDIYTEANNLDKNRQLLLDSMQRSMILMKLDYWKEKMRDAMDLVDLN